MNGSLLYRLLCHAVVCAHLLFSNLSWALDENANENDVASPETAKVVVDLFTSIHCSHCYQLHHFINAEDFGKEVVINIRPVLVWPQWRSSSKAFLVLMALERKDLVDELYKMQLKNPEKSFSLDEWSEWATTFDIDKQMFERMFLSPEINKELQQSEELRIERKISVVPTIIINGESQLDGRQLKTPRLAIEKVRSFLLEASP